MSYTIYHEPQTRSGMVLWLAEEIGAPYAIHWIDTKIGAGKDAGFTAASPFEKVPAIRDGATAINETGAIALYLADKYSYGTLAPKIDDPRRGDYLRWMFTANSSLDSALVNVLTKREPMERAQASLPRIVEFIEKTVTRHPFVTGDSFTAVDVLVASGLYWGRSMKAFQESKTITDYMARTTSRPASERARAKGTKPAA